MQIPPKIIAVFAISCKKHYSQILLTHRLRIERPGVIIMIMTIISITKVSLAKITSSTDMATMTMTMTIKTMRMMGMTMTVRNQ